MAEILRRRLEDPEAEARKLAVMGKCLDLRTMAFDPNYGIPDGPPKEALRSLYRWLETRFQDTHGNPVNPELNDMPPFGTVWAQRLRLHARLLSASSQSQFKERWMGASGTLIMADV